MRCKIAKERREKENTAKETGERGNDKKEG